MMRRILAVLVTSLACLGQGSCSGYDTDIPLSGDIVGEVTLFAFPGDKGKNDGILDLGHAFISFQNLTDESFRIGGYEVEPGETVTVSSWAMSSHAGIWYNIENYYVTALDRYEGRYSYTLPMYESSIEAVSEYIYGNDSWHLFRNCAYAALNMFNICAPREEEIEVSGNPTPGKLYAAIALNEGYQVDRELSFTGKIGYCTESGRGEFVTYEAV